MQAKRIRARLRRPQFALAPARVATRARRTMRTTLLQLEQLEDRTLLAPVSWLGGSGDWNNGANWSNGVGPGPDDDTTIDVPGITVTHSTGSHTVKSLT